MPKCGICGGNAPRQPWEHGVRGEDGVEIGFPLTHWEISFLVGAHRVTVTRAMKGLRASRRIVQKGRTLVDSEPRA